MRSEVDKHVEVDRDRVQCKVRRTFRYATNDVDNRFESPYRYNKNLSLGILTVKVVGSSNRNDTAERGRPRNT